MPVKWILVWDPDDATMPFNDRVYTKSYKLLEKNLANNADFVSQGSWRSTVTWFETTIKGQPRGPESLPHHLLGFSLAEEPNNYYFIRRGLHRVIEGNFTETFFRSANRFYELQRYNFAGLQYQVKDHQLRIGKYTFNETGTLCGEVFIECDYLLTSSIEEARTARQDFVDDWNEKALEEDWPGRFLLVDVDPEYPHYGLPDQYSSHHTVVQYKTIMFTRANPYFNWH